MVTLLSWLFYHGERRATTARGGEGMAIDKMLLMSFNPLFMLAALLAFEHCDGSFRTKLRLVGACTALVLWLAYVLGY